MTEPTMYVCMAPGCRTPGHDASLKHEHTFSDATRAYLEAEAAAVAKRTVPVTLVHCMNPNCTTSPHSQAVQHKCTLNKKAGKS